MAASAAAAISGTAEEDDFVFEEQIARDRYNLGHWVSYIAAKRSAPLAARVQLYERAVSLLPGSYKLWHAFLSERIKGVAGKRLDDPRWQITVNTFERALVTLHKCPRIWLMLCELLVQQRFVTGARRAFDRALQSLPVTQHERVWKVYLGFVRECGSMETAVRVYRRYLKFDPSHREEYVDYLLSIKVYDEAAQQLAEIVNDEAFVSLAGKLPTLTLTLALPERRGLRLTGGQAALRLASEHTAYRAPNH